MKYNVVFGMGRSGTAQTCPAILGMQQARRHQKDPIAERRGQTETCSCFEDGPSNILSTRIVGLTRTIHHQEGAYSITTLNSSETVLGLTVIAGMVIWGPLPITALTM